MARLKKSKESSKQTQNKISPKSSRVKSLAPMGKLSLRKTKKEAFSNSKSTISNLSFSPTNKPIFSPIKDDDKEAKLLNEPYLPVNYNDVKVNDNVRGLLENDKIGCAAVDIKYKSKLQDVKTHNPCIYYVLKGNLVGKVGDNRKFRLKKGDTITVAKGEKYHLQSASTFGSKLMMFYYK